MAGPLDRRQDSRLHDGRAGAVGGASSCGDLGADVIKIEPPEGDTTRQLGPARNPGMAAFYLGCNRSKRSIVLDLKQDSGRKALFKLAETADVLMHNYRPEPARRLGVEYEAFEKINPRLVYLATYGYRVGRADGTRRRPTTTSSRRARALPSLQSVVAGQPRFLPTIVADKTSSNGVVSACWLALFARERTGKGQAVEVPMYETPGLLRHGRSISTARLSGRRSRSAGYKRVLNKERRPYPSKDGYFALLPYTDGHWKEFCDPDRPARARRAIRASPRSPIASRTSSTTTRPWPRSAPRAPTPNGSSCSASSNVPHGPVNTLEDLFVDPQLQATGYLEGESTIRPRAGCACPTFRRASARPSPRSRACSRGSASTASRCCARPALPAWKSTPC